MTAVKKILTNNNKPIYSHFQPHSNLPGDASVVEAFFSREDDPQSPSQILSVEAHDLKQREFIDTAAMLCFTWKV